MRVAFSMLLIVLGFGWAWFWLCGGADQQVACDRAVGRGASPDGNDACQGQRQKHDAKIYPHPVTFGILRKHENVE
jgi:hypothetical protein